MYHITRNVGSKYGSYVRSARGCSINVQRAHTQGSCTDNQRSEKLEEQYESLLYHRRENIRIKAKKGATHSDSDTMFYPNILLIQNVNGGGYNGSTTYMSTFQRSKILSNFHNNLLLQRHSFHVSSVFLVEESEKKKVIDQVVQDEKSKVEDFVEHQRNKEETKGKIVAASQSFQKVFVYKVDKSETEPSTSTSEKSVVVKEPWFTRIWTTIKKEARHYYNGFRLLYLDTRVAARLLWKTMNGKSLTRRENKQFRRTVADLFRLVPFSVFLIIPFMELLLPVAIKLFPGMLPSTFEDSKTRDAKKLVSLKMRLEMAEFLQDTIQEISVTSKKTGNAGIENEKLTEFSDFLSRTKTVSDTPSNSEIMKYSKLFEDEITLENIPYEQLKALCRVMMISPIGILGNFETNFLRLRLRLKLEGLKKDDQLIRREGIDSLNIEELQLACSSRGMRSLGLPLNSLKSNLKQWLELSLDENIPASLLLLSRTLYMTKRPYNQVEQLKLTISHLPERLIDEMELKIGAVEGENVDPKTRIDIIEHEEEQIAAEKLEKRQKEAKEDGVWEEKLSKEELEDIEDTLSLSEKDKLQEIKEEREEYIGDVQDLKLVQKSAVESVASVRLGRRLDAMLQKLEKSLNKTDVSHMPSGSIDLDEDGIVTTQEVESTLKRLRNAPDEAKTKRLLEVLDDDHDGVINLDEMRMAVKLLAEEDLDLSQQQVEEVLALLKNTENILTTEHILNKEKTNYLIKLIPTVYNRSKSLDNY